MLYLSGKISDPDPIKQRANLDLMNVKAKWLREKGLEVFNPAEWEEGDKSWEWYLARDLKWIIDNKPNSLWMMKGWEESRGCRLEREWAELLGIKIDEESD